MTPAITLQSLPDICTIAEAAHALRTSARTIRRMISMGRIRPAKLSLGGSSRVLIARSELERLVSESML